MELGNMLTIGAILKNHKGIQFTLRGVSLHFNKFDGVRVVVELYNPKSDLYGLVPLEELERKMREGIFEVVSEGK